MRIDLEKLKFCRILVDNLPMGRKEVLTRTNLMIQWIGILITVLGLAYTGVKDYQKGDIRLPSLPQKSVLTKPVYPVQYCLMAYDPNIDKVFYLHDNGTWHDYAPEQRRYATETQLQQNQNPSQTRMANAYGSQGGSFGHYVR